MPLYFVSPNIPTDPNEMPQLVPEPIANELQKELHQTISVPANPIVMRVPGIEYPGVPYDYGWHMHQIDWAKENRGWQGYPLQAPDVIHSSASYTEALAQAAKPIPTLSVTGWTTPLRAPGINEGV